MSDKTVTDAASDPVLDKARETGTRVFKKPEKRETSFPWIWLFGLSSAILAGVLLYQNRSILRIIPYKPPAPKEPAPVPAPVPKPEPIVPQTPDRIKYYPKTPEKLTKRQLISRLTDSRVLSSFD